MTRKYECENCEEMREMQLTPRGRRYCIVCKEIYRTDRGKPSGEKPKAWGET